MVESVQGWTGWCWRSFPTLRVLWYHDSKTDNNKIKPDGPWGDQKYCSDFISHRRCSQPHPHPPAECQPTPQRRALLVSGGKHCQQYFYSPTWTRSHGTPQPGWNLQLPLGWRLFLSFHAAFIPDSQSSLSALRPDRSQVQLLGKFSQPQWEVGSSHDEKRVLRCIIPKTESPAQGWAIGSLAQAERLQLNPGKIKAYSTSGQPSSWDNPNFPVSPPGKWPWNWIQMKRSWILQSNRLWFAPLGVIQMLCWSSLQHSCDQRLPFEPKESVWKDRSHPKSPVCAKPQMQVQGWLHRTFSVEVLQLRALGALRLCFPCLVPSSLLDTPALDVTLWKHYLGRKEGLC